MPCWSPWHICKDETGWVAVIKTWTLKSKTTRTKARYLGSSLPEDTCWGSVWEGFIAIRLNLCRVIEWGDDVASSHSVSQMELCGSFKSVTRLFKSLFLKQIQDQRKKKIQHRDKVTRGWSATDEPPERKLQNEKSQEDEPIEEELKEEGICSRSVDFSSPETEEDTFLVNQQVNAWLYARMRTDHESEWGLLCFKVYSAGQRGISRLERVQKLLSFQRDLWLW